MRYRPGLKGSILCLILSFLVIYSISDKESSLYCDRRADMCSIKTVPNIGSERSKNLIPVSQIKSIEYSVKKAGKYSKDRKDYVGSLEFLPKNGTCTFEIYRKFSTNEDYLNEMFENLAAEIESSLKSGKSQFRVQLFSRK